MIILISTTTETLLAVLLTWKLQMGSGTQRQEICRLLLRLCCGRSPSLRRDAGLGCTGLLGLNHDAASCATSGHTMTSCCRLRGCWTGSGSWCTPPTASSLACWRCPACPLWPSATSPRPCRPPPSPWRTRSAVAALQPMLALRLFSTASQNGSVRSSESVFLECISCLYALTAAHIWCVLQVQLTVPFSRTSFSTTASFEVRSPKRLQVRE